MSSKQQRRYERQNPKTTILAEAQVGKGGIRNIVVAVQSYDKSMDFIGAAGVADPDSGAAMTPDTPYFIASVTKMYTAAIVMKLHEEKRLDLESPVADYLTASMLDGIHIHKGTDYSRQLKVYQLVNQTSGLADFETDKPRSGKSVLDELMAGHDRAIDTVKPQSVVDNSGEFTNIAAEPGKKYFIAEVG